MLYIVKIEDDTLFRHIYKYWWKEWSHGFKNIHGFNTLDETIKSAKAVKNCTFYACLDDDGKCRGCFSITLQDNDYPLLGTVLVFPQYRKQGIGSMMISYALEHHPRLNIISFKEQYKFYQKHGFETVQTIYMTGKDGKQYDFYKMTNYTKDDELYEKKRTNYMFIMCIMLLIAIGIIIIVYMI